MDQDLQKLQEDILAKKARVPEDTSGTLSVMPTEKTLPPVEFNDKEKNEATIVKDPMEEAALASAKAGKMVTELFEQAVVHTIKTDDEVKEKVLDTAKQAINDKADALRNQTDKEAKASYFSNHEDACKYFGYEEKTTSTFHVKLMAFWAMILNTLYICTFGFFIVSPLTFLCKKVKVIIKQTWLAFIVALLIYILVALTPVFVNWLVSTI